jgi:hypothetical protein
LKIKIIGLTGTTSRIFRKYLSNISGKHGLCTVTILGSAHVLGKVLM